MEQWSDMRGRSAIPRPVKRRGVWIQKLIRQHANTRPSPNRMGFVMGEAAYCRKGVRTNRSGMNLKRILQSLVFVGRHGLRNDNIFEKTRGGESGAESPQEMVQWSDHMDRNVVLESASEDTDNILMRSASPRPVERRGISKKQMSELPKRPSPNRTGYDALLFSTTDWSDPESNKDMNRNMVLESASEFRPQKTKVSSQESKSVKVRTSRGHDPAEGLKTLYDDDDVWIGAAQPLPRPVTRYAQTCRCINGKNRS
ncbi:hypothetical protein FB45DRAFT_872622 [Roridomyces roridus]|uniref:Uncharacterized protein n=1 Tax=Roridomyces roridus TaxID=1738132 RepID=A0AAD7BCW1_9AGAR|nr:hypothetical protein FB45DRAFT_872622 [Roridomyces roridus]